MIVGLTYDLRDDYLALGYSEEETAEFDARETIDALEEALWLMDFEVVRVGHLRELARRLVAGERWDLVFNIAEGLRGPSREAQVPALLEAYGIPYTFADPLTLALALDKSMAKRVVRDHGIPTAPFFVLEDADGPIPPAIAYPLFVKPIAEGTGKGINAASHVGSEADVRRVARELITRHGQAVLVEAYLPGRELTVGIVGNGTEARAIGVMEVLCGEGAEAFGYSYENKEHYESRVSYRLVGDREARLAEVTALAAWSALRCRDGGRVDLRSDALGVPHFLEVNPLAGLHPVRSDLVIMARLAGSTHAELIGDIVGAALSRLHILPPVGRKLAVAS